MGWYLQSDICYHHAMKNVSKGEHIFSFPVGTSRGNIFQNLGKQHGGEKKQ